MKIRSRKLYTYLSEVGVLNAAPEAIAQAKKEYRKKYKRDWKKQRLPARELRPSFTLKEYELLKLLTKKTGCKTPTRYIKQLTLASLYEDTWVPNREELLQALQCVSMALNVVLSNEADAHLKHIEELLSKAEASLLRSAR